MHDIKAIVEKLLPVFDSHKDEEHIEVEMRLGKYNGSFFDTNVGKITIFATFGQDCHLAQNNACWKRTSTKQTVISKQWLLVNQDIEIYSLRKT